LLLCPCPHAFVFLLLAPCQFAQLLQGLVDGVVDFLAVATLHFLVLVAQSIELQFEEIGEFFPDFSLAAPAAILLALRHLHVAEHRLGSLEILQRSLLGAQRRVGVVLTQGLLGLAHFPGREGEEFRDSGERRVGGYAPVDHALCQAEDLLAQPALRQCDGGEVFFEPLVTVLLPVANQLEGGGHDHALLGGEFGAIHPSPGENSCRRA